MLSFIQIRPNKHDQAGPEAEESLLSAYRAISKRKWWQVFGLGKPSVLSLEIGSVDQQTIFQVGAEPGKLAYLKSQLLSHHSEVVISQVYSDFFDGVSKSEAMAVGELRLQSGAYLPLLIDKNGKTNKPLIAAVLGYLAKVSQDESALIQIVLRDAPQAHWRDWIRNKMSHVDSEGKTIQHPHKQLMEQKIEKMLFEAQIRIIYVAQTEAVAAQKLAELGGTFGVYSLAEGNSLTFTTRSVGKALTSLKERTFSSWQPRLVLNSAEVASLWRLPGDSLADIGGIRWGKTLASEPPEHLSVAENVTETDKSETNFFAKTVWRNREVVMGLKREDRRKHTYVIGKTGAGKSTLIANMAINDIRNGEGVAIIDPHGDLSEIVLDYIPKRRLNDVIYLDPTLSDSRAFSLNLFDADLVTHTDVIASGIVSVFKKLYGHSWGPRLEYILRNTVLSLLYLDEATFVDIPKMLTNDMFRKQAVAKIAQADQVLGAFWTQEFETMNPKFRAEAIAPVLNKVGQFLSAQRIRRVVGSTRSTFSLDEVMDQGKILIVNLSQGKLGEDTTALLGAMLITKIQLVAMKRVSQEADKRKDFYLYVDEFQNFATDSFTKILSEARKYKLNLLLANQYIDQVADPVQKAIFGNVGTLATFVVGASDAAILEKEFGGVYTKEDLVGLGKFEILLKMAVDGLTSTPFAATTLPLPSVVNGNREKILQLSLERYYRKVSV